MSGTMRVRVCGNQVEKRKKFFFLSIFIFGSIIFLRDRCKTGCRSDELHNNRTLFHGLQQLDNKSSTRSQHFSTSQHLQQQQQLRQTLQPNVQRLRAAVEKVSLSRPPSVTSLPHQSVLPHHNQPPQLRVPQLPQLHVPQQPQLHVPQQPRLLQQHGRHDRKNDRKSPKHRQRSLDSKLSSSVPIAVASTLAGGATPTATSGRVAPVAKTIFCDWEWFNVSCSASEVLIISRARYGRMELNRCVSKNYGHLGCGNDVTARLESACAARESCALNVISLHDLMTSCPPDLKAYAEVQYHCVRVLPLLAPRDDSNDTNTRTHGHNHASHNHASFNHQRQQQPTFEQRSPTNCAVIDVSGQSPSFVGHSGASSSTPVVLKNPATIDLPSLRPYAGYLASYTWLKAAKALPHRKPCSWILSAAPYQKINFTLIDFSWSPDDSYNSSLPVVAATHHGDAHGRLSDELLTHHDSQQCRAYATLSDEGEIASPEADSRYYQSKPPQAAKPHDDRRNNGEKAKNESPLQFMSYNTGRVNSNKAEQQQLRPAERKGDKTFFSHHPSGRRVYTVCRRQSRESVVYTSTTSRVSVAIAGEQGGYFLLKYQVFGCKPLQATDDSWVEILDEGRVVVHCKGANRSSLFVCNSTHWVGYAPSQSCPTYSSEKSGVTDYKLNQTLNQSSSDAEIFFGILFVIALGIIVGIIVGMFLLVSVLLYQRKFLFGKLRRRRTSYRGSAEHDLVSSATSGFIDEEAATAEGVLGNQHVHHTLLAGGSKQAQQYCLQHQQHPQSLLHHRQYQTHCALQPRQQPQFYPLDDAQLAALLADGKTSEAPSAKAENNGKDALTKSDDDQHINHHHHHQLQCALAPDDGLGDKFTQRDHHHHHHHLHYQQHQQQQHHHHHHQLPPHLIHSSYQRLQLNSSHHDLKMPSSDCDKNHPNHPHGLDRQQQFHPRLDQYPHQQGNDIPASDSDDDATRMDDDYHHHHLHHHDLPPPPPLGNPNNPHQFLRCLEVTQIESSSSPRSSPSDLVRSTMRGADRTSTTDRSKEQLFGRSADGLREVDVSFESKQNLADRAVARSDCSVSGGGAEEPGEEAVLYKTFRLGGAELGRSFKCAPCLGGQRYKSATPPTL